MAPTLTQMENFQSHKLVKQREYKLNWIMVSRKLSQREVLMSLGTCHQKAVFAKALAIKAWGEPSCSFSPSWFTMCVILPLHISLIAFHQSQQMPNQQGLLNLALWTSRPVGQNNPPPLISTFSYVFFYRDEKLTDTGVVSLPLFIKPPGFGHGVPTPNDPI